MKINPTIQKLLGAIWIGLGVWGITYAIYTEKLPKYTTRETIENLIAPVGFLLFLSAAALYKFMRPESSPQDRDNK